MSMADYAVLAVIALCVYVALRTARRSSCCGGCASCSKRAAFGGKSCRGCEQSKESPDV